MSHECAGTSFVIKLGLTSSYSAPDVIKSVFNCNFSNLTEFKEGKNIKYLFFEKN